MNIFQAIILGVVQGITEFLPVSSSGHLVLLQKIFGISEPALFFDTMVHVGTLVAVCAALRNDIWNILRRIIQPLTGLLIIATIPAVIIALLFKNKIESAFESGAFLGFAFLLTALALALSELLSRRQGTSRGLPGMSAVDALVIGVMQGIAIIPGVSRSGFTLSGALSLKLERGFAARFSFLLSIPAILGAFALQLKDVAGGGTLGADSIGALPIIAGTAAAAIVGFLSVTIMLRIVQKHSLAGFAVYTGVLGILVLIDQFAAHIVF
ncbi:MAG: undecaprenyl-diphosphate phosphatase [Treponemataceae bacterium]|nr:MAG: undecaprenyl-diphosphate phosphatase [Treponemataceae bacterium]